MKGGLKWPPKVTCKLCSYSKSYDLLIHQGQIANVHGVIIFQAAKEQNCSKLALLRGGVAAGEVTEMVVSRLSEAWFNIPQCYIPQEGAWGPHDTWSVADKTAPGQNFMNKNKTPLIFHGNMLMSTLIIVHVNISSSWLRIRLGVVRSWLIFEAGWDTVVPSKKDFMKTEFQNIFLFMAWCLLSSRYISRAVLCLR